MGSKEHGPPRSSRSPILVVAAVAAVVVVLYFVTTDVVAAIYSTGELARPVPYTEVPYTNIHRGTDQLCRAVAAEKARPSTAQWHAATIEYNKHSPDAQHRTGNDYIKKLRHWPDAESGVVGRDRVLCAGTHHDADVDKIALQYHKWSGQCDYTLIFATKADIGRDVPKSSVVEMHPLGNDGSTNLWQRLRFMVKYIAAWPHLKDIDFVFFYGDDVYASVKNLKKMLREPQYAELDRLGVPLVLGHRMVSGSQDIFVSNAAYIFNVMVIRILDSLFTAGQCSPDAVDSTDDLPLAQCLSKFGIYAFDSYDDLGEDRITLWNPHLQADLARNPNANSWYPEYRVRPIPKDRSALSKFSVMWHYMDLAAMDQIEAEVRKETEANPDGFR
jgi:hypothetical protein